MMYVRESHYLLKFPDRFTQRQVARSIINPFAVKHDDLVMTSLMIMMMVVVAKPFPLGLVGFICRR